MIVRKMDVTEQINEIYEFADDEFKQNNLSINLSNTTNSRRIKS